MVRRDESVLKRIRAFLCRFRGVEGVTREVKAVSIACPVALACLSCGGGGDGPAQVATSLPPGENIVQAGPPAAFTVVPLSPDTLPVYWVSAGPVGDIEAFVSAGEPVSEGDTLAVGVDSMAMLELQLSEMSLSLARARVGITPGDTLAAAAYEIALERHALLEAATRKALVSPVQGTVVSVSPRFSQELPAAVLLPDLENRLLLVPPPGAGIVSWPDPAGELRFLETYEGGGIYSGDVQESLFVFPGSFSVPGQAVRSSGLESFIILESGDSVSIEPICSDGTGLTVTGPLPAGSGIRTWARPSEDQP